MLRFPGYGPQFQYYSPFGRNNFYNNYKSHTPVPEPVTSTKSIPEETQKSERSFLKKQKTEEPVWFDLFGIKLYFDDVLILSLLFFLYKEEVKDEGLFLALVLLLIS